MKANSPLQLALIAAGAGAIFVGALAVLLLEEFELGTLGVFLLAASAFIVIFIVSYYLTEKFLYEKIKLIYKNIRSNKAQKGKDSSIKMSGDVLADVSQEVETWAHARSLEIEKLREQEAFRREFLGNLAHELKTPVFSIQGYILTLLEGGLDDPSVNHEFLMRAAKGVDRMTHIIEDLDVIMKMESSKIEMNLKKEDVVSLGKEILESMESKAKEQEVKLILESSTDKPIFVEMDRGRIGQVLTNLINNAINYSQDGGGEVRLRFHSMNDTLLIEVADNGLGIAEHHLPRLFERFYRVDKSRSRHVGGTGLGLAIVKHIVEAHGQTINVRSTEGVGSTFAFTLSLAR